MYMYNSKLYSTIIIIGGGERRDGYARYARYGGKTVFRFDGALRDRYGHTYPVFFEDSRDSI